MKKRRWDWVGKITGNIIQVYPVDGNMAIFIQPIGHWAIMINKGNCWIRNFKEVK